MTQTGRQIIFRTTFVVALLAPLAFSAAAGQPDSAGLCAPGEKVWFNAEIQGSKRYVSLCGAERVNDRIRWLQFRMGLPGDPALAWPQQRKGSAEAFTYRRYTRYRVTLLKLGFLIDGRDYAILEYDVSEDKPGYGLQLRIRQASTKKDLETHTLKPVTQPLSLMRLENLVPNKPFDE